MDLSEFINIANKTPEDKQYKSNVDGATNVLNDPELVLRKLKTALYLSQFCGLCLEGNKELCTTKASYEIIIDGNTYEESMTNILFEVFHDAQHIPANKNICMQCLDKTIQSYIFIKNTKETVKVINNYVNSFYSKTLQLSHRIDPIYDYSDTKFVIIVENDERDDDFAPAGPYYREVETSTQDQPYIHTNNMTHYVQVKKEDIEVEKEENRKYPAVTESQGSQTNVTKNSIAKLSIQPIQPIETQNNAFKCEECDLYMKTFKQWKQHEHTYHKKGSEHCKICFKSFGDDNILTRHYKTHNRLKCIICHSLVQDTEFQMHLKLEHDDETYSCEYCDFIHYTESVVDAHTKTSHYESTQEVVGDNQCTMCLNYYNDNQIKNHPCRFKCVDCTIMPCIHYKYLISYRYQKLESVNNIKCLDCDYECHKKENFIAHVNQKHLNYHPHKCNICDMQYYSKVLLESHMIITHEEKYDCVYCVLSFKNKESLQTHEMVCSLQGKNFIGHSPDASSDVQETLSDNADHQKEDMNCRSESKSSDNKGKFNSANRTVRRPPTMECSICDIKFASKVEYLRHIKSHGSNVKYPCRICNIEFDRLRTLTLHNRKHRKPNKADRKVLEAEVNSDNKGHLCDTCGKSFLTQIQWYNHRKVHSSQIQCKLCNKLLNPASKYSHQRFHEYQQNPSLRKRANPNRARPHKCPHCEYAAFTRGMLEAHVNRYHLKVKPYVCEVEGCNVAYSCRYQLNEHKVNMHTAEKWFTCTVCNKTLRNKSGFKKHMMQHNGESPYVCEKCGDRFKTLNLMKEHRMRHEGKTISCPLCTHMFYQYRDLRFHIRKYHWKHKDKPFDHTKLKGLSEKDYYIIFHDRRKVINDVPGNCKTNNGQ